jgi:hypothetical protein
MPIRAPTTLILFPCPKEHSYNHILQSKAHQYSIQSKNLIPKYIFSKENNPFLMSKVFQRC